MPEPTLSDIHVDSALTDFSVSYFQQADKYVAPSVFPTVNVQQRSNKYYVYTKADLLRSDARKRAPGTESAVRSYKLSTNDYYCEVYSIAIDVSEQERANADPALDPEEDAALVTAQDIMILRDRIWTESVFSTGIWGTESTATWNTSTGDVVGDLKTGILSMLEDTGYRPNTLVLGANAWYDGIWGSTQIIEKLSDASPRIVTEGFIKDLFGFDRVFVLDSVENTAGEGVADDTAFIHDAHALLLYVDPGAGLRGVTAGKTFNWSGLTGGGGGIRTKRLEIPHQDAMPRVEADSAFDFAVTASDLGYLIKFTNSSTH